MKADAALVGADGGGVLNTVTTVDLHLTMVINPRDAEHDDALWFNQAIEQAVLRIFRMLRDVRPKAFDDFGDGLQKLRLPRIADGYLLNEFLKTLVTHHLSLARCMW